MFRGENLQHVVVAQQQPERRFWVLSAEIFDDGTIIRHIVPNDAMADEESVSKQVGIVGVRDDVGTDYRLCGGQSGGESVLHGMTMLNPAPPKDAKTLTISTSEGDLTLEIQP